MTPSPLPTQCCGTCRYGANTVLEQRIGFFQAVGLAALPETSRVLGKRICIHPDVKRARVVVLDMAVCSAWEGVES